VTVKRAFVQP